MNKDETAFNKALNRTIFRWLLLRKFSQGKLEVIRFLEMDTKRIRKVLSLTLIWPAIAIVWLHIPIANIPIVFATMPLGEIAPIINETNEFVEWYFFGPVVKSFTAFFIFGIYFWVIGLPVYTLLWWIKRAKNV